MSVCGPVHARFWCLFDRDERSTPSGWWHRVVYDLPKDTHGLAKGDPPHRYVFTIYALNVAKLPVAADSSGTMVTSIAQDHLLGKAVFVAHYGR